jgi:hypothetical protein
VTGLQVEQLTATAPRPAPGLLLAGAEHPGPEAAWPWALMAALTVIPAVGLSRLLPAKTQGPAAARAIDIA